MNTATHHRGPDGTIIYSNGFVTFGHNRLAVIDLSERANQPMHSNDGRYTIVFNGEIYNFKELRNNLNSVYQFKTHGDTEVLLAAYTVWGEEMLHKLRGVFAFALLDNSDGSILLVRDQVGVKPLYYSIQDGVLTFSSELAGMIAAGNRTLDQTSATIYMSIQYVPGRRTLIAGVSKLQPGELLKYKNGVQHLERYPKKNVHDTKNREIRSTYDVIDSAVKRQMVSDREVGLFLSGGLDSSIVLHHAKDCKKNIRTFSLGFELEDNSIENIEKFNYDVNAAELTSAFYGTTHQSFILTLKDVQENFENALGRLDEPVANPTSFTKYMLSKWVREAGVVVALGGDGGDEMFKGYQRYRIALGAEYYQRLPLVIQKQLGKCHSRFRKLGIPLGAEYHASFIENKNGVLSSVWKSDFNVHNEIANLFQRKYEEVASDLTGACAFIETDQYTWLPDESLHTSDRASMAHGLEYRVPLLDLDVMAHASTFKLREHMSPISGKRLLRSAYRSKLPPHLFKAKKRGWLTPAAKWVRNETVKKLVTDIMSDDYYDGFSDIIDWNQARVQLDNHITGKIYAINPIWNLIQLQVWGRKNNIKI